MNHISFQTAISLKEMGMPQPTPQPGIMFYLDNTLCMLCCIRHSGLEMELQAVGSSEKYYQGKEQLSIISTFAPSLEYITAHFPPGEWSLDIWDGRHSCKFENEETILRTMADSFTEAAALVYLSLKQNAPGQTFVQPGDAKQE